MKSRMIVRIWALSLLILVSLSGCVNEKFDPDNSTLPEGKKVNVELAFRVTKPSLPTTRSMAAADGSQDFFSVDVTMGETLDEASTTRSDGTTPLYNLWLFQFNQNGSRTQLPVKVADVANPVNDMVILDVTLTVATNQTLYLVALGKSFNHDLSAISSRSELESYTIDYTAMLEGVKVSTITEESQVPYAGCAQGIEVVQTESDSRGAVKFNTPEGFTGGIKIAKLMSKVTLTYQYQVDNYIPTGVRLRNVNTRIRIAPFTTNTVNNSIFSDLEMKTPVADANGVYSVSWYVAPNIQGTKSIALESDRYALYNQLGVKIQGDAPEYGMFFEMWGQSKTNTTDYVRYQIFIGKNNTSDFNVEANNYYNLTTLINTDVESAKNDNRVTEYRLKQAVELYSTYRNGNSSAPEGWSTGGSGFDIDAHYDSRPLVIETVGRNFVIGIYSDSNCTTPVDENDSWLKISSYSNYTDALVNNDLGVETSFNIVVPTRLTFYIYNDEYIPSAEELATNSANNRSLYVKVRAVSSLNPNQVLSNDIFTLVQRPIMNLGRLGGTLGNNAQYSHLLGVDLIDECGKRYVSAFPYLNQTNPGVPWGYSGWLIGNYYPIVNEENGKLATRYLAENPSGYNVITGITGNILQNNGYLYQYNYYNTYAARFCYDRNRDLNGNGRIDDDELKWYLPSRNQMMGAWVQCEINAGNNDPFYKGTSCLTTEERTSITVRTIRFGDGYSDTTNKYELPRLRCVRDIEVE